MVVLSKFVFASVALAAGCQAQKIETPWYSRLAEKLLGFDQVKRVPHTARITRFEDRNCTTEQALDRLGIMGQWIVSERCWTPKDHKHFGSVTVLVDELDFQTSGAWGYCGINVFDEEHCDGNLQGIIPEINDPARAGIQQTCANRHDGRFPPLFPKGKSMKLVCKDEAWELDAQHKLSESRRKKNPGINEWDLNMKKSTRALSTEEDYHNEEEEAHDGEEQGDEDKESED